MGMFSELLKAEMPADVPTDTIGQSLRKGWDAGVLGAGSQLQSLTGLVGEAVGADKFAQNRHAAAKDLQLRAAEAGPQVREWKDVNSLRDFGNYAAGVVGGSAPVSLAAMGAGALTGGGAIPAMLAAGAVTAPFEMGDVVQKQMADPEALRKGAGERLGDAVLGGGASALAQGIVPGVVAGKLLGKTAAQAVPQSFKQIIGKNLAGEAGMEAVAEGSGEAIKQFASNQGKPLDWDQIKENAIGGAVGGGAMGTLGAAGDLTHSLPGKAVQGVKDTAQGLQNATQEAFSDAKGALAPAWEQVGSTARAGWDAAKGVSKGLPEAPQGVRDVADYLKTGVEDQIASARMAFKDITEAPDVPAAIKAKAKEAAGNLMDAGNRAWLYAANKTRSGLEAAKGAASAVPTEDLMARFKEATTKLDDTADRIIKGTPLGDLKEFATAQGERASELVSQSAQQAADWTSRKYSELSSKHLSQQHQDMLASAAQNLGDRASQVKVATVAKAVEAKEAGLKTLDKAHAKVKALWEKHKPAGTAKKSDDYEGFEELIKKRVAPMIQESHPHLLDDPQSLQKLGGMLRMFAQYAAEGNNVRTGAVHSLVQDVLGPDLTHDVLNSIHEEVTGGDTKKKADYFNSITQMVKDQKTDSDLVELIGKSTSNEASGRSGLSTNPQEMARILKQWARGDFDKGLSREQATLQNERFMQKVDQHFGTKSRSVLKAVQTLVEKENDTYTSGATKTGIVGDAREGGEDASGSEYGTTTEGDANGQYVNTDDEPGAGTPKLYKSSAATKLERPGASFEPAVDQAIKRYQDKHPGADVTFVKLRDYAKAHGLSESQLLEITGGDDPGKYGHIKVTDIPSDDGLRPHQLRSMRMADRHVRTREGDNKDAIFVPGTNMAYDSTRIATEMHKAASGEWSDAENAGGMPTRMAKKFAEGLAALSQHHGKPMEARDDQVIYRKGGEELTWGEAKKLLNGKRTADDAANDADTMRLVELRKEFAATDHPVLRDAILKEAAAITRPREFQRDKELSFDRNATNKHTVEGDRGVAEDGQIHQAAADNKEADLIRHNTELRGESRDKRTLMLAAEKFKRGQGAIAARLGERLGTLVKNFDMMSDLDQARLKTVALDMGDNRVDYLPASEAAGVINPLARKYADRIMAPGQAVAKSLTGLAAERLEYLNKPPDDYTPDKAAAILKWGETQLNRVSAAIKNVDELSDRHNELSDMRLMLKLLVAKGKSVVEGDESLKDFEGSTPNPKVVAAKKAAFLERAASGDKALIEELQASTDAKGLQRAAEALVGQEGDGYAKTLDTINARLSELVQDPAVAYGLQTKKYSLESGDGPGRLISRLAAARQDAFTTAPATGIFRRLTGKVSFGPLKDASYYFFNDDSDLTHAYVIPDSYREVLTRSLKHYPEDRHADVLTYFAVQHASYNKRTHSFQSFGPAPDAPGGVLLGSLGALGDTGENFEGGIPMTRVEGVTDRQLTNFLADALAYTKHVTGEDQLPVNWKRETGAKKGKEGSGMFDRQAATGAPLTAKGRAQVLAYVNDVLGPTVMMEFKNLMHAGEFDTVRGQDIIRVSVHALNPTTVAYHESLHAFFKQLRTAGSDDITQVLERATGAPAVMAQLRKLLAHSPDALAQLNNPEERAAYMYQFWANGQLKLGGKADTLLGKVADFLRKVMGIWTNDERALHVMEYFSTGEYAKAMGQHSAVREALMGGGRNRAVDAIRDMAGSFLALGEAVFGAGSANLRDSGVPALHELADIVKKRGTDAGGDAGYIPAARLARTKFLSKLAQGLGDADEADVKEALTALETGTRASSTKAKVVQATVRKVLDEMYGYLQSAGVNVNNLGVGKDYFPRRWNPEYLASHKAEFMAMAAKYPQWTAPHKTYQALVGMDGMPMPTVDRPGMASAKERMLSFVSAADAAPFMSHDLYQVMDSYITQATRRAEWSRRLGDTNEGLSRLYEQAKQEGASDKQIDEAKQFVAGVTGTLGDDLNPTLRRHMGNMIVYQNIRLLPLAIFSSLTIDPIGLMVRGGTVGEAWSALKRSVQEIPKGLRGDTSNDAATQLAEDLGVIDNATLQHALGSLYTQGMVGKTAQKINDAFFRFNLMEQQSRSMRVAATAAALQFMLRHSDPKFSPHSARWMAELGLQAGDVQAVHGKVATSVAEGLTEAQAARVKAAVNQWVDGAVLRPDAADKPVWMNDPRFMLMAHLKQFVYAFHHTILHRVAHEYRHGNITPALAMTSYVPMMLAADLAKGMLQGGGDQPEWKRNWTAGDYLMNATERAGLFGVGQFGVEAARGSFGMLAGPTLEQFGDATSVLAGREQFKTFALHSLPANSVYASGFGAGRADTFHDPE